MAPLNLNLCARWEQLASRFGRFISRNYTDVHCMGCWVDPRADLDAEEKIKLACPCGDSHQDRPARSIESPHNVCVT